MWRRRFSQWSGCLLPVVTVLVVVVGFAGYLVVQSRFERAHPPAPAPEDLCAAIGTSVFERLVPDAVARTESNYSSGSDAACDYATDENRTGADGYGFLHVRLLRYGQVGWNSGTDRASRGRTESCDDSSMAGPFHPVRGLGENACAAYGQSSDDTGSGSAVVQRGADLLWVDYYRHPGTEVRAREAVDEVVLAALAGIA